MLETPALLVASPQMVDPFFGRTVILLWTHTHEGSMGLIMNRPLGIVIDSVLEQLDIKPGKPMNDQVLWGGPVMPETGFLACRAEVREDEDLAFRVTDQIFVSSSRPLLKRVARGELDGSFYLCLGYAGWGPRQLDDEIERGSWIVIDLDEEILFSSPLDERWDLCIKKLGVAENQIWMNNPIDE